ncbi:glycosyltransferase family 2 protein [Fulvivirga sp. M361]|uniref:glycosyltransferase family 2 protein n=1 Tax=Fulvivirga sp. M361 TaxID=2594266 RepID=UPI00117B1E44|nr:glycosyltransferase family 2 protein [Fulvivirga sp. M361]TRX60865.1 glycosyltransferase family 2 protein [Fulvivirga sp. M361]
MKITGTIITYNEENNIRRCITSMRSVVDEIIVVDSYSTDGTKKICIELGVTFVEHEFEGHIQQKNYAVSLASHDFVLSLDADEALSETLQRSIATLKNQSLPLADAYEMNRLTSYCGKWIKHCGWYPDTKFRLWNKTKGLWGGENPHDKVILSVGAGSQTLVGDILHYSYSNIADHVRTANAFSDIAAREGAAKGKKVNVLIHMVLNPVYTFIHKYFIRLGFLDGFYGFVICYLSAVSNFLKYAKMKQLTKDGK